jgi:hypothetical protein
MKVYASFPLFLSENAVITSDSMMLFGLQTDIHRHLMTTTLFSKQCFYPGILQNSKQKE